MFRGERDGTFWTHDTTLQMQKYNIKVQSVTLHLKNGRNIKRLEKIIFIATWNELFNIDMWGGVQTLI